MSKTLGELPVVLLVFQVSDPSPTLLKEEGKIRLKLVTTLLPPILFTFYLYQCCFTPEHTNFCVKLPSSLTVYDFFFF